MGKKNLDSILIKNEKVLPEKTTESLLNAKKGRTTKPVDEKESEPVTLKITPKELAIVKEKAGELVPLGTLIKHYLRTKTDLFIKTDANE